MLLSSNYPKSVVMNKIVTILVAAMFFLVSATYSQTSLTISPTTITGNTGETVTVSLVVNNFTDIVSMQYGIKWDPAVIQYSSVDNFNLKDLSAGNFNANVDDGFLSFSWFDNTTEGVSAPDGTTIFTMLNFKFAKEITLRPKSIVPKQLNYLKHLGITMVNLWRITT